MPTYMMYFKYLNIFPKIYYMEENSPQTTNPNQECPYVFFTSSLLISFIILNLNKISNTQTSLVDARRNPTYQVGRRLIAVFHANMILDGIADVRSFMAAVVHRHNLLTRKRDKNATSSVALPDSIGIRNAAVITIGSIALVKTGIYQLFQVFTDVYLKLQG